MTKTRGFVEAVRFLLQSITYTVTSVSTDRVEDYHCYGLRAPH